MTNLPKTHQQAMEIMDSMPANLAGVLRQIYFKQKPIAAACRAAGFTTPVWLQWKLRAVCAEMKIQKPITPAGFLISGRKYAAAVQSIRYLGKQRPAKAVGPAG